MKAFVSLQMFGPRETLDDDLLIDLIYAQIVNDVFSGSIRIMRDDADRMKSILSKYKSSAEFMKAKFVSVHDRLKGMRKRY